MVQYIYTLGAAGERLSVTELDRTVEYTYDSLYRLTSETITDENGTTVYTYAYDSVSNRTLKTVNGEETVYTYNALNQLVSENDIVYEYDLNGNTVRMTSPEKSALYVYNAENRLIRATVQSGNNVSVEEYKYVQDYMAEILRSDQIKAAQCIRTRQNNYSVEIRDKQRFIMLLVP